MNVKGGTKNVGEWERNKGLGTMNVKGGTKNAVGWTRNKG